MKLRAIAENRASENSVFEQRTVEEVTARLEQDYLERSTELAAETKRLSDQNAVLRRTNSKLDVRAERARTAISKLKVSNKTLTRSLSDEKFKSAELQSLVPQLLKRKRKRKVTDMLGNRWKWGQACQDEWLSLRPGWTREHVLHLLVALAKRDEYQITPTEFLAAFAPKVSAQSDVSLRRRCDELKIFLSKSHPDTLSSFLRDLEKAGALDEVLPPETKTRICQAFSDEIQIHWSGHLCVYIKQFTQMSNKWLLERRLLGMRYSTEKGWVVRRFCGATWPLLRGRWSIDLFRLKSSDVNNADVEKSHGGLEVHRYAP